MAKSILIYSRKSAFTGKGDSIENQIDACRDYAVRQFGAGCKFFIYEDEGFSGRNTARPEFQRLLRDMRTGRFDALICYRLDRISRSVSDFSAVLEELTQHHVDFVSVREHFDTSTPIGRAMIYIASVFAELERETAAERIRDNKFKLYRLGYWQGGFAPAGMKTVKICGMDETGRKRTHFQLETDPQTAPHVRMLFDKFMELGSISKLENSLLAEGIKNPRGNAYSKGTLRQILMNPIYARNEPTVYDYLSSAGCDLANGRDEYDGAHGLIAYGKTKTLNSKILKRARAGHSNWIVAVSPHKGLIPGGQWTAVQTQITANSRRRPRSGTSSVALLSGLLRCGKCGAPMSVKGNAARRDGSPVFYYKCDRKDRTSGADCDMDNISGVKFDSAVVDLLKNCFSECWSAYSWVSKMFEHAEPEETAGAKQISALRRKICGNGSRLTNLALRLSENQDPALDGPIYDAMKQLQQENARDQRCLDDLLQSTGAQAEQYPPEAVYEEMSGFCRTFEQRETAEKRRALQLMIKSVVWYRDHFAVELYGGKAAEHLPAFEEASGQSDSGSLYHSGNHTGIRDSIC